MKRVHEKDEIMIPSKREVTDSITNHVLNFIISYISEDYTKSKRMLEMDWPESGYVRFTVNISSVHRVGKKPWWKTQDFVVPFDALSFEDKWILETIKEFLPEPRVLSKVLYIWFVEVNPGTDINIANQIANDIEDDDFFWFEYITKTNGKFAKYRLMQKDKKKYQNTYNVELTL